MVKLKRSGLPQNAQSVPPSEQVTGERTRVVTHQQMRDSLGEAIGGTGSGSATVDRLCDACVRLLNVDGASISLMHDGTTQGTFGSSGALSEQLDELQFTFGVGPCIDAVRQGGPVLIEDLGDPGETRWPAYAEAVVNLGVRAVYALPVMLANSYVGALDLYRHAPGPLLGDSLIGALLAAELAALPLLDLLSPDVDALNAADEDDQGWDRLASLSRVEVFQATGMLMGQLDCGPPEALIRLRAHAFANGLTASQVAWSVVERHLVFEPDGETDLGGEAGLSK
jgi:GAF domain/ANTAR domain